MMNANEKISILGFNAEVIDRAVQDIQARPYDWAREFVHTA